MLHKCTVNGSSRERIKLQFQRKLQFTLPSSVQCMQDKTNAGPLGALLREERIFLMAQRQKIKIKHVVESKLTCCACTQPALLIGGQGQA